MADSALTEVGSWGVQAAPDWPLIDGVLWRERRWQSPGDRARRAEPQRSAGQAWTRDVSVVFSHADVPIDAGQREDRLGTSTMSCPPRDGQLWRFHSGPQYVRSRAWRLAGQVMEGWWGDDPKYHAPTFVLTHHEREPEVWKEERPSSLLRAESKKRSNARRKPPGARTSRSEAACQQCGSI